ncbi:unnamed protein product [Discosporangium mesarthrocarpum]
MVMCARLLGASASCTSPFALCGHDSGSLCCYDLRINNGQALLTMNLHKEPVLCVDMDSSCKHGVSGSADSAMHMFKLNLKEASCQVRHTFHSESPGTSCVEIRPDEKLLTAGGWDRRLRIFSWRDPRPLAILRCHEESVYCVDYSPQVGVFAAGSKDNRISIWNVYPEEQILDR